MFLCMVRQWSVGLYYIHIYINLCLYLYIWKSKNHIGQLFMQIYGRYWLACCALAAPISHGNRYSIGILSLSSSCHHPTHRTPGEACKLQSFTWVSGGEGSWWLHMRWPTFTLLRSQFSLSVPNVPPRPVFLSSLCPPLLPHHSLKSIFPYAKFHDGG